MPSGQPSSENAKKNVAALVRRCEPELTVTGFLDRRGTTFWRRTNRKFDILKIDVIPKARCDKWRIPVGSFSLEPSCLFPFLPVLGRKSSMEDIRPDQEFGQIRLKV